MIFILWKCFDGYHLSVVLGESWRKFPTREIHMEFGKQKWKDSRLCSESWCGTSGPRAHTTVAALLGLCWGLAATEPAAPAPSRSPLASPSSKPGMGAAPWRVLAAFLGHQQCMRGHGMRGHCGVPCSLLSALVHCWFPAACSSNLGLPATSRGTESLPR